MKTPMISVVMPTYYSEKHVAQAVQSVLSQTYGDFELLIVNEYSADDGTRDTINGFHDPRIHFIQNTQKQGVAESRNIGMRLSRGKYIAYMDSDDISVFDRFERQVAFMDANPEIAISSGWMQTFGRLSVIMKKPASHEEIKAFMLFGPQVINPIAILRREEMLKHNLWYDPTLLAEDYEFWTRAVKLVKFANLQEVLGYYRTSETSATAVNQERFIEQDQELYGRQLKDLGIEYARDYPAYTVCGWQGCLARVPQNQWKERLETQRKLLNDIMTKNKELGVYDERALSRTLHRQYMHSLDITGGLLHKDAIQPYEYFADNIIDDLAAKILNKRFCLFGVGGIGCCLLPYFKRRFGAQLVCVSDNDPRKWGQRFDDLECVPPDVLSRDWSIVITTGYDGMVEISAQLAKKGFARVLPFVSLSDAF